MKSVKNCVLGKWVLDTNRFSSLNTSCLSRKWIFQKLIRIKYKQFLQPLYNCHYYVNIAERTKISHVSILLVFSLSSVFWNLSLILLNGLKEILDFSTFYHSNRFSYISSNKMPIEYLGPFMTLNTCNQFIVLNIKVQYYKFLKTWQFWSTALSPVWQNTNPSKQQF